MKEIQLTQGRIALVDDDDYERVSCLSWSVHSAGYAIGYDPEQYQDDGDGLVLMHRFIMDAGAGDVIDHRDHNRLNNQRDNIVVGTQSDNMMNRSNNIRDGFSSKYRGVHHRGGMDKSPFLINDRGRQYRMSKPWQVGYKGKYLAITETEKGAAYLYDLAALRDQGPGAQLNFPKEGASFQA